MPEPQVDPRIPKLLNEIENLDDRAVAIVLAAIVQDYLRTAVISSVAAESKAHERMFGGLGPLSTFSALIDVGLLLGLYREDFARVLHALRKIRNTFSHEPFESSFDTASLHGHLETLRFIERYPGQEPRNPRERFVGACQFMLGALYFVASEAAPLTVSGKVGTLP